MRNSSLLLMSDYFRIAALDILTKILKNIPHKSLSPLSLATPLHRSGEGSGGRGWAYLFKYLSVLT